MKHRIYLSLGSNVGDRRGNLARAMEQMRAAGLEIKRVSSFYETEPVDCPPQDWFVNCAVEAETVLEPRALLDGLQDIERRLGRRREVAKGPRTLDIDLLLYDDRVFNSPDLILPHPRMAQRRFALEPLAEIAPELRHPASGRTMQELLAGLRDSSRVERVA